MKVPRGGGDAAWKVSLGEQSSEGADPKGRSQGPTDGIEEGGPEKPVREHTECPYRKPTQVGRGQRPEANGRPLVKELGKLPP